MSLDSSRICWLNGAFVAERDAHVSIFDRGALFGDGVYEVASAMNGRLLDADLHLARLERSMRAIGLEGAMSTNEWLDTMQTLLDRNGVDEGFVYLEVTRGTADRDFPFPVGTPPTQFSYSRVKSFRNDPNAAGIALHSVRDIRWVRRDIKSVSLLAQVLAKQEARAAGAFEALMHEDGVVTEGGSSNIWIVKHGLLITRPLSYDILAGITRAVVLDLAASLGMAVEERAFTVAEARAADECFITSATSFVLAATRLDGHVIGEGTPGPVASALRAAYMDRAERLTRSAVHA